MEFKCLIFRTTYVEQKKSSLSYFQHFFNLMLVVLKDFTWVCDMLCLYHYFNFVKNRMFF